MKTSILLTATIACLAPGILIAAPEQLLKPGDPVKTDALVAAKFIRGEAPVKWKKDQLYVLDCWATWCGPCIASMPHLESLVQAYKKKPVSFYAINVWEEKREKVEQFLETKQSVITCPVAFDGMDGRFSREWMKASGVNGIPTTFVVLNGRLLFHTNPSFITTKTIDDLLSGGARREAVIMSQLQRLEQNVAQNQADDKAEEMTLKRLGPVVEEMRKLAVLGKYDECVKLLDTALANNKQLTIDDKQRLGSMKAMMLREANKLDAAIAALNAAIQLAPDTELAVELRIGAEGLKSSARFGGADLKINALAEQGEFAKALTLARESLEKLKDLSAEERQKMTFLTAALLLELKRHDECLTALNKAKTLAPHTELAKECDAFKANVEKAKAKAVK